MTWSAVGSDAEPRRPQPVVAWSGPGADTFAVSFLGGGRQVRATISGSVPSTATDVIGQLPVCTNVWNQLAITWRYPQLRIYWNVALVDQGEMRSVVGRAAPTFRLGGAPHGQGQAAVALDELWIYDRALIGRELSQLTGPPMQASLGDAQLLQRDFVFPAQVLRWSAELRGALTDHHHLRLDIVGVGSVTLPWADDPVFLLDAPLPIGKSRVELSLREDERELGRVAQDIFCTEGLAPGL